MAGGARANLTTTARMVDKASPVSRKIRSEVAALATAEAKASQKMSVAADKVTKALKAQLSPSQQVKLAIREQSSASGPLQKKLVQLERQYLETEKRMRALARSGQRIPAGMARQAARAREMAETLRKRTTPAMSASNRAMAKGRGNSVQLRNAVFELGNNLAITGGQAGLMANQVLELSAGMIGGGGLAIAMGAVIAGVVGLSKAYKVLTADTRELKQATSDLRDETEQMANKNQALRDRLLERVQGEEFARQKLRNLIAEEKERIQTLKASISAEENRNKKFRELNLTEEERENLIQRNTEVEREQLAAAKERIEVARTRLGLLEVESQETERLAEAEKNAREAAKAAAKAQRELGKAHHGSGRAAQTATAHVDAWREAQEKALKSITDARKSGFESGTSLAVEQYQREIMLQQKSAEHFARVEEEKTEKAQRSANARAQLIASNVEFLADKLVDSEATASEKMEAIQERAKRVAIQKITEVLAAKIAASVTEEALEKKKAATGIATAAAEGQAKAVSAHAGIPFVGIAVGLAAAAAIAAAIFAFRKGFAHGGTVEGGTPGKDSVPIMAQQGEVVLPVGLSKQLKSVVNSRGPRSSGSSGGGGSGFATGGTVASRARDISTSPAKIELTVSSQVPPNRSQMRRAGRDLSKSIKEMQRRGQAPSLGAP